MSVAESGGAQVKSAVRTVELLEYFAGRPGMHSLAAVQEAVGYPKSSLYMLLRTLVELGYRHALCPFQPSCTTLLLLATTSARK